MWQNGNFDVAIIVEGLFERSDSIGFDAVYQYKLLSRAPSVGSVRLFAGRADAALYPSIPIESLSAFLSYIRENPGVLVIYHFCDGWSDLERELDDHVGPIVVRWHNCTPPWFYAPHNRRLAERCVRGFEKVIALFGRPNLSFWTNSQFSSEQIAALNGPSDRCHVVYPASRYLDLNAQKTGPSPAFPRSGPLKLLFVGRVVAHKGHKHIISIAAHLKAYLRIDVCVDFAGRADGSSSAFNQMLHELPAKYGVEVNFHGEVPEEELLELYKSADVFVCMSEHEGFGMPVFEAMRCNVPVVAWACAALRELLQTHPLASERYDVLGFCAAIVALLDEKVRQAVVAHQARMLGDYTADVVLKQLNEALSVAGAASRPETNYDTDAIAFVRAEVASIRQSMKSFDFPELESLPHDFDGNLVSLYDIASYRQLLDSAMDERLALQATDGAPNSGVSVKISPAEFFTHVGERREDSIAFPLSNYRDQHLVYGPYIRLPVGQFQVEFLFDVQTGTPALEVDVYCDGEGIVARRELPSASLLAGDSILIEFENGDTSAALEFRLMVKELVTGQFSFRGVLIRRIPSLEDLESAALSAVSSARSFAPPAETDVGAMSWLSRILSRIGFSGQRKGKYPAGPIDVGAAKLFKAADRARDNGSWNEAASLYERGLSIHPQTFEYRVQWGHALKESGRLREAEQAYLSALALHPEDVDLRLQLGHLYKLSGRIIQAERSYLKAIAGQSAVLDAFRELQQLGAKPEILMEAAAQHD